jgi:hypothetical protein
MEASILLIERDARRRALLGASLRDAGFAVTSVARPADAPRSGYAAIVTDDPLDDRSCAGLASLTDGFAVHTRGFVPTACRLRMFFLDGRSAEQSAGAVVRRLLQRPPNGELSAT